MSSWCTLRGPSWFASHVSMCWMLRSCNPPWFVCNIFVCRRSTACVFICQCHWGFSSTPSLWILSFTLDESIAKAPLHCCHHHLLYLVLIALLLPLLRGFSPASIIEHVTPRVSAQYLIRCLHSNCVGLLCIMCLNYLKRIFFVIMKGYMCNYDFMPGPLYS